MRDSGGAPPNRPITVRPECIGPNPRTPLGVQRSQPATAQMATQETPQARGHFVLVSERLETGVVAATRSDERARQESKSVSRFSPVPEPKLAREPSWNRPAGPLRQGHNAASLRPEPRSFPRIVREIVKAHARRARRLALTPSCLANHRSFNPTPSNLAQYFSGDEGLSNRR